MNRKLLAILLSLLLAGGVLAQDTDTDTTDTTDTTETEPVDPATDPAEDPLADPAEDPLADPAEDPLADPAKDPLADPAEDPMADPAEDPMAEPVDPAADPTAEPVDPAAEPVDPAADPVADPAADPAAEGGTVLDTLAADPEFSTLVSAVQAAGLESTLAGEGPFTIFAPTNAAFEAIAPEELDALLADPVALQAVLLNHVVAGEYMAADVAALPSVTTMQMEDVAIASDADGDVTVGDAAVVQADIVAANGVVHAIDTVILPQASAGLQ